MKLFTAALALPLALAACDKTPTAPEATSQVSVKFGSSASASLNRSAALFATSNSTTAGGLVIEGRNGTLTITNVSFIVSELELECEGDDDGTSAPACIEFEAPPSFVALPLGSGAVEVTSKPIPAGTYTELEFEVENVEVDDDDDQAKRQQVLNLLASIRQSHADFPEKASMVVEGDFNGTPFRVYFDAEIRVEMLLSPALTISDTGASRSLSVDVQPASWFKKADGTVMDLSQFDYAKTGTLIEFEMEMDKGFSKVEFDD